jgi:uncharacterized protein YecE (DUF72 family)
VIRGRIEIGTSGYVYRHWRGVFYPEGLKAADWLAYYARHFSTVELNATFYRLPTAQAVEEWRRRAGRDFVFACKGSRFLTHMKRLRDTRTGLRRFFTPVSRLGPQLGAVLWQLPPQMDRADPPRLDAFLEALPPGPRYAVEFRAVAWHTDEVWEVLERHGAALCEHDLLPRPRTRPDVGFRYLRFHGSGARYAGRYGRSALTRWARDLAAWRESGRDGYVYFNNDGGGAAVQDARTLLELLETATPFAPEAPLTSRRARAPSSRSG